VAITRRVCRVEAAAPSTPAITAKGAWVSAPSVAPSAPSTARKGESAPATILGKAAGAQAGVVIS